MSLINIPNGSENILIEGITFDSSGNSGFSFIDIDTSTNVSISGCVFNWTGEGTLESAGIKAITSSGIISTENTFSAYDAAGISNLENGIIFDDIYGEVVDNILTGNFKRFIKIDDAGDLEIHRNDFSSGNLSTSIPDYVLNLPNVEDGKTMDVHHNTFDSTAASGILRVDRSDSTGYGGTLHVYHNTIDGQNSATTHCIYLSSLGYTGTNKFRNNILYGAKYGVYKDSTAGSNNFDFGYSCGNAMSTAIYGNIVGSPFTGDVFANPLFEGVDDYHVQTGSPCVDAGDPTYDYSKEPAPNGLQANIGRYGNTADATVSGQTIYVKTTGTTPTAPYDTEATAISSVADAITYAVSSVSNHVFIVILDSETYSGYTGDTLDYRLTITGSATNPPTIQGLDFTTVSSEYDHFIKLNNVIVSNKVEIKTYNGDVEMDYVDIEGHLYLNGVRSLDLDRVLVHEADAGYKGIEAIAGSGIFYPTASLVNVTVDGFDLAGIDLTGFNTTVRNIISSNNSVGITVASGTYTGSYGCFFNTSNYDGVSASGIGDFSADPLFEDATGSPEDHHLTKESPCCDTGYPGDDYSLEPNGGHGRINIGRYGNTDEATFDDQAPENVTTMILTPQAPPNQYDIKIDWTNPTIDWTQTRILRRFVQDEDDSPGRYPLAYDEHITDPYNDLDGTGTELIYDGSNSTCTDTGVIEHDNFQSFGYVYYMAFTKDDVGNWSTGTGKVHSQPIPVQIVWAQPGTTAAIAYGYVKLLTELSEDEEDIESFTHVSFQVDNGPTIPMSWNDPYYVSNLNTANYANGTRRLKALYTYNDGISTYDGNTSLNVTFRNPDYKSNGKYLATGTNRAIPGAIATGGTLTGMPADNNKKILNLRPKAKR
mgnify:CR=1 FL=1